MRAAVFLDRDDTLIASRSLEPDEGAASDAHLGSTPVRLLPGAIDGCRLLHAAGFALIVVDEDDGGAASTGARTHRDVEPLNRRMREMLLDESGEPLVEAVYLCRSDPAGNPESSEDEHRGDWHESRTRMLLAAKADLGLDLSRSWMVGGQPRDAEAARRAGIPSERTIVLDEGAPDVLCAALIILGRDLVEGDGRGARSTATLRVDPARESPLRDASIRETIMASARALAERIGVRIERIEVDERGLRAVLDAGRLVALGFAAELRRSTEVWHAHKHGGTLWIGPDREDEA